MGETRFNVTAPPSEITGKPIDREALGKLGTFYTIDNWNQWKKDLHIAETRTTRDELFDLWNHWILLTLLCLLLATDWAARKYRNLP